MTPVGWAPACAARRPQSTWSSSRDVHATWCTVPAPGSPRSGGGGSSHRVAAPLAAVGHEPARLLADESEAVHEELLGGLGRLAVDAHAGDPASACSGGMSGAHAARGAPSASSATTSSIPRPSGSDDTERRPRRAAPAAPASPSRSAHTSREAADGTRHTIRWIMPAPGAPRRRPRDLEERQEAARAAGLVAEVQVVHVRRVEVDGLLDQAQAHHPAQKSTVPGASAVIVVTWWTPSRPIARLLTLLISLHVQAQG